MRISLSDLFWLTAPPDPVAAWRGINDDSNSFYCPVSLQRDLGCWEGEE